MVGEREAPNAGCEGGFFNAKELAARVERLEIILDSCLRELSKPRIKIETKQFQGKITGNAEKTLTLPAGAPHGATLAAIKTGPRQWKIYTTGFKR